MFAEIMTNTKKDNKK